MNVRIPIALGFLALIGSVCAAQLPEGLAYLKPGTPEVGGVRDLCLIYHGMKSRVAWTKEALMPYVAYVDEQGRPRDWLFDSFLFIEFATDSGAWLHAYRQDHPQATAEDWVWLADCWFRQDTGLIGLEQAVAEVGATLGDPDRKVNVVITMPKAMEQIRQFGPLAGRQEVLDFSRAEDQHQAMAWYIERVLGHWQQHNYQHLNLVGCYWLAESIAEADHELVRWAAEYLHARGQKLYWIPYFGASGLHKWQERGIDATMLQPNYFFQKEPELERLPKAARRAGTAGCGIEIEFDARALISEDYRQRFYAYLDAGVKYGWMNEALLGYYEGGRAVKIFAETPGLGRELYEAVYRFVKGSYQMSGKVDLSGMEIPAHDNTGNLALATKGARIHGCVRHEDQPELAPEKIIDGDIYNYGGMYGYGYFAWPNSFTIELPQSASVARTHTMLHDSVGQSFRYRIETSTDNQNWEPAVDKSEGEWRGWQVDEFAPREAKYIRFTGLHNTANANFQVVEFEAYAAQQ